MKLAAGVIAALVGVPMFLIGGFVLLMSGQTCVNTPPAAPTTQAGVSAPGQQGVQPTGDQLTNAKLVLDEVKREGLPQIAGVISLAAALQESGLKNYQTAVDHDSLGVFQQRPSTGWGTPDQIRNVGYATYKFLQALQKVPGWQTNPIGPTIQKVQASANASGSEYSKWQGAAQALVQQLWGAVSGSSAAPAAGPAPAAQPVEQQCNPSATAATGGASGGGAQTGKGWPDPPNPLPKPGWQQTIGVPKWPGDLPGNHVNPPAITNQCVAGALWAWAAAHDGDPGWNNVPAMAVQSAYQMAGEAQSKGFVMDSGPHPGDMVVFRNGSFYGSNGHVAEVIAADANEYVVVEQNFVNTSEIFVQGQWGTFDERAIAWPDANASAFIKAPPGVTPKT